MSKREKKGGRREREIERARERRGERTGKGGRGVPNEFWTQIV